MRPFQVYDTRTGTVRPFVPRNPPRVGMFVCGLTPYAEAHAGHGRVAVVYDAVARAVRRWGYRLFYVQNVTNVDDKVIDRARELNRDPLELSEHHFRAWLTAVEQLEVRSVNLYPFATDYVPEIVEQVEELVRRGLAYVADGDVYYEVAKFPRYGELSGQRVEALRPGARVQVDPKKRAPEDFVIWKSAKPGEPTWPSPWGPGRPGWHVEDTAITGRLLGPQYDLHGGGTDLKFPHHEAEVALGEGASGRSPLVGYWLHLGMLEMRGEKMAKSVGNVVSLEAAIRIAGPEALRFFYLNAHYRSPLVFDPDRSLAEARQSLTTLGAPYLRLREELGRDGLARPGRELPPDLARAATAMPEQLDGLLANDFATREAIAALFGWSRTLGEWTAKFDTLSGTALATLGAPYRWAAEVLGLFPERSLPRPTADLSSLVRVALDARARARARNDFAEADRLRDALAAAGVVLEDDAGATRWRWRGAEGNP